MLHSTRSSGGFSSHKSICNWVHRYNTEGIEGLKDKPRSGRRSRLNS
ncbi:MAG: helix-turn-helix domain-containing protein, partial [Prevotellaceae bacterium]|nr:helix-turn-helix domain-containing protein [Prevotellaceae bacterium]